MHRPKRPRFHVPKVRITRFVEGRMITTYEPLTLPNAPERVHTTPYAVAEASGVQSDEPVACNSLSYSEGKQKSVDDWAAARSELDEALILSEGRQQQNCVECNQTTDNIMKCVGCGPSYWACEGCAVRRHEFSPLHPLKMWKVNT